MIVVFALVAAVTSPAGGPLVVGQIDGVRVIGRADTPRAVSGDGLSIAWDTAPPIGARARLAIDPGAQLEVVARAGDDPLVVVGPHGAVLAAELADPSNRALARWSYLPWLRHALAERAAGRDPGRFADWPDAPLVHRRAASAFAILWALLVAAAALAFAAARRRARAEPDAHVRFFAPLAETAHAWMRPGMARPLGGFLLFLSSTVLALGPYLWVTAVAWPRFIQPFPEVDGSWGPVDEMMVLAWILVDFGISTAFVQRFAERRRRDPAGALRGAQLYLWWQIAGGLVLLGLGGAAACGILPHTRYALFARVLLVRSFLQVPGVLSLFTLFFQAAQRFDHQLGLDLLQNRLLIVAVPMGTVLAGRAFGRAHPSVGEPFGAVLGLAAGQYLALAITFGIGLYLFKRLKLPLGPLFHAGFDRATARDLFRFGAGIVGGKAPYFIANALEIAILTSLLAGYPAWLGIRQLLQSRLVFVLYFAYPFLDSAMPALSEALGAKKRELARYYVVRYLQWGHFFVGIVIAFLVGAGRPLALHALSSEWRPVATYLPLAAGIGLFLPSAWLADSFQNGAGRTGLNAGLLVVEQALRVTLLWLLVPRLGFAGIFAAQGLTIFLKSLLGWWVNHRVILRLRLETWTSLGAPLVAGGVFYLVLTVAARLLPDGSRSAILLFAAAALAAFPIGLFILGLVGGLDRAALDELERAAELTSFMRPVARRLHRAARAGARLAPRPATATPLAAEAEREVDELTHLRN